MIPIQDLQALRQAMSDIEETYIIYRKTERQYNEHGRIENTVVKQTITGSIQPGTKTLTQNSNGHGQWISIDYTLYLVAPQRVYEGDIIKSCEYGWLKVVSIPSGTTKWGAMAADLKRLNSTEVRELLPYEDIVF